MPKDTRQSIASHPGEILKEDFLEPLGISVYALANALQVPRSRLNDIVLGRRGISADTAVRLAKFFETDAQSWLNLQQRYDLIQAESEASPALAHMISFKEWQSAMLR
jgi:addiction module HigA family antidote